MVFSQCDIEGIIKIVLLANESISRVYNAKEILTRIKDDMTPVTEADQCSEDVLIEGLRTLYPKIPIISEESSHATYEERKNWEHFWLIDPLDGTKEFVNRNGEFTVNLALINKDKPALGIVSLPVLGILYFAYSGAGAFKRESDGTLGQISAKRECKDEVVCAASRSHTSNEESEFIEGLGKVKKVHLGSALKFCYVAEGKADIYVRLGPTMEWDTAAGHCVVENAGGKVFDLEGNPVTYNKPHFRNSGFVCVSESEEILEKVKSRLKT